MTWVRFLLILGMALALGSSHELLNTRNALAQDTLPPDIEADRLLLKARKAYAKKDWKRAAASFAEIQALKTDLPVDFHYFYGITLRKRGDLPGAKKHIFRYLDRTGRKGKYFKSALDSLNDIEDLEKRKSRRKKRRMGAGKTRRGTGGKMASRKDFQRGTWKEPATGMSFVAIQGGTFEMGCHEAAGKCDLDEGPPRMVRLDDFWMGKYEVTQGQWRRIMGKNPSQYPGRRVKNRKSSRVRNRDQYPVEKVSWRDAQNFIRRLNRKSRATFRLPSEAEWEYACRARGKALRFGTARGNLGAKAGNFLGAGDGYRFTAPVGKYPPNALGLFDMSGNVLEWVQDNYSENFKGAATENPIHVGSGPGRGGRGGSWKTGFQRNLRCTHRDSFDPSVRYGYLGFRLVRVR